MSYDINVLALDEKYVEKWLNAPLAELIDYFQSKKPGEPLELNSHCIYCAPSFFDKLHFLLNPKPKLRKELLTFWFEKEGKWRWDRELSEKTGDEFIKNTAWEYYSKHAEDSICLFYALEDLGEGCKGVRGLAFGSLSEPIWDLCDKLKGTDDQSAKIWCSFLSNRTWPVFNFSPERNATRRQQTQDEANQGNEYGFVASENMKKLIESGEAFLRKYDSEERYAPNFSSFLETLKPFQASNKCLLTHTTF